MDLQDTTQPDLGQGANEIINPDELGLSEEPQVQEDPIRAKYQTQEMQQKWVNEFESARKELKSFHKQGNQTIERYIDKRDNTTGTEITTVSHYNLFYANTEIKEAALYAMTPSPSIKRRFDDPDDEPSRVAAELLKRNIEYELDIDNFDDVAKAIVHDRVVPGMGVAWVRYEQEGGEEQPNPQGGQPFLDANGIAQVHPPTITSPITHQAAIIDYVPWDDFLWSPCRIWSMCRWVARCIPMDKDAIKQRFGSTVDESVIDGLSFEAERNATDSNKKKISPKHGLEKTVDVKEVWDKQRHLVWWIADGADVPLDVVEDTMAFPNFFPTPLPPLGRFSTSNTTPISDYYLAQDLYNQLDDLNNRIAKLINAMRFFFLYDASNKALQDVYTTTAELQGVPVDNWAEFVQERGGFQGAVQTSSAIINDLAASFQKLVAARDIVKAQIDDIEGISDLLRGEAVPNETKLQTSIKSAFGTSRLAITQQRVAEYIAAVLRLKAQIICKFYTPQTIIERAGIGMKADQAYIPAALQLLKNDEMRSFRLSVSVDTLQLPNWNVEKAERTQAFQAVMGSLGQMGPMFQQYPQLAMPALELVRWCIAGYKGSEDIQGLLDQTSQQFVAMLQQNPPGQQPNPEMLKAQAAAQRTQADVEIASQQEQTKRMKLQMESQERQTQQMLDAKEISVEQAKVALQAHEGVREQAHQHAMDYAQLGMPPIGKP